jgi:hypothetical protein
MWSRLAMGAGPRVRHQPLLDWTPPAFRRATVRLVRPHELDRCSRPWPCGGGASRRWRTVGQYHEDPQVDPRPRAYAKFIGGRVVFQAGLAVVTRHPPGSGCLSRAECAAGWRRSDGRGGARRAAAHAERPVCTSRLQRRRQVYDRCGFRAGTFATVLLPPVCGALRTTPSRRRHDQQTAPRGPGAPRPGTSPSVGPKRMDMRRTGAGVVVRTSGATSAVPALA